VRAKTWRARVKAMPRFARTNSPNLMHTFIPSQQDCTCVAQLRHSHIASLNRTECCSGAAVTCVLPSAPTSGTAGSIERAYASRFI
jgi:hypothetical protein